MEIGINRTPAHNPIQTNPMNHPLRTISFWLTRSLPTPKDRSERVRAAKPDLFWPFREFEMYEHSLGIETHAK
jgi:hypothetical protein